MRRRQTRVAVTGMGVVTPAAVGVAAFTEALRSGTRRLSRINGVPVPRGKDLVGRVEGAAFAGVDKARRMAVAAAREAVGRTVLDPRTAVLVGTIAGFGEEAECRYPEIVAATPAPGLARSLRSYPNGAVLDALAALFGLRGPALVATNACASGNVALGIALDWIRRGRCDQALVVGLDVAKLSTIWGAERSGFIGYGLRPFDVDRDGAVLGDGAAALLLSADHRLDGIPPLAWIDGFGCVCDVGAGAITLNDDGSGLRRAMAGALADGGLAPEAVGYVSAHAPGTKGIDLVETIAVADLFGSRPPAVNATKSITTHLSGASAIVEVIATVLQMSGGFVHGNIGLSTPDPALRCPVEGPAVRPLRFDAALSNACGGGGANTTVLVRSGETPPPAPPAPRAADIVVTGVAALAPEPGGPRCTFDVVHHYPVDRQYHYYSRAAQLAAVAAARALSGGAGPLSDGIAEDRVAVVAGTCLGGAPQAAEAIAVGLATNPNALRPSHALDHGVHLGATLVCRHYGFTGPTITLAGSAAAGVQAMVVAADLLRLCRADMAIVLAYDAWDDILAKAAALLPGCRIEAEGEGAVAFVLERRDGALRRGVKPWGRLADDRFAQGESELTPPFFAATPFIRVLAGMAAGGTATVRVAAGLGAPVVVALERETT